MVELRTDVEPRSEDNERGDATERPRRRYLRALGPGLITGASDDDPSGVATYAQSGAQYRYGLLWLALVTWPLMSAIQETCDRTALATGQGLGELISQRFNGRARLMIGGLLVGLCVANLLNMAADLVAIGEGMHLLHAGPSWLWAVVAGLAICVLLLSGSFETIAHIFKVLCLALLTYIVVLAVSNVDWHAVLVSTFIPHITWSAAYLALVIAVLGTTISPYLYFWQSANRIEELRAEPAGGRQPLPLAARDPREATTKERTSRLDVFVGMTLSNCVMFAIIVATGSTIGAHGSHQIATAAEAAEALRPLAGSLATVLFAVGFIATGFLAVPVLAGSGSAALSGLLGKRWGFSRPPQRAPLFYGLVVAATLGASALTLLHVDPIALLVVVAVINGVAAAPFLAIVMLVAGDRRLMGKYTNGRLASVLGWTTFGLMAAAGIGLLVTFIS
jgi:NRAMP (natural resistance-associated macrophage protein)-like metal ion transporter